MEAEVCSRSAYKERIRMFSNIRKVLSHGDYKPVAIFLFAASIWLGINLFLEPNNQGVIPIPLVLQSYGVEDIIAYICILVGIPGFVGITVGSNKILTAFLLTLTPVYVFIAALFLLSPNPSVGSTFFMVALASGWATIRSVGDGFKQ